MINHCFSQSNDSNLVSIEKSCGCWTLNFCFFFFCLRRFIHILIFPSIETEEAESRKKELNHIKKNNKNYKYTKCYDFFLF